MQDRGSGNGVLTNVLCTVFQRRTMASAEDDSRYGGRERQELEQIEIKI